MRGVERCLVLAAIIYMAVYVPFFFMAPGGFWGRWMTVILPLHFLSMLLNLIAIVLTIRDLYLRRFPTENAKLTWLLLILCTGGIGWLVYVFKHALKPR
jgi:hypothetical protein